MDFEMSKAKRAAEAKSDLIGWMYCSDMCELLGMADSSTDGERRAWDAFTGKLANVAAGAPVLERNRAEDLNRRMERRPSWCTVPGAAIQIDVVGGNLWNTSPAGKPQGSSRRVYGKRG